MLEMLSRSRPGHQPAAVVTDICIASMAAVQKVGRSVGSSAEGGGGGGSGSGCVGDDQARLEWVLDTFTADT